MRLAGEWDTRAREEVFHGSAFVSLRAAISELLKVEDCKVGIRPEDPALIADLGDQRSGQGCCRRGLGGSVEVARRLGVKRVLPKPFTRKELLAAARESVEG